MALLNARVAAATIYATIDRIPKIDVYSTKGLTPKNPKGKIQFKNVHFRYPSRKNAKVLNESGIVTIDKIDVRDYNISHLRNICGIVQQEPILFNGTIAENLKIGYPECSRKRMIEVCKMANAHEFIEKFPQGYDTLIGDGGIQLSGE
uniref:Uncharacterized protein n=1 Tax=Panagrolaimus sp. JU765 TaxID=591449 RepID=A0AC34R7K5_9BILA